MRDWEYFNIGFSIVLHYRRKWVQRWLSKCDAAYDGYLAATPSGYSQDGYDNVVRWGEQGMEHDHVDTFTKRELTWTPDT
jgi:hypothetical protein